MTKEEWIDWLCRLRTDLNNGVIFTPWNKEFIEALNIILEQQSLEDATKYFNTIYELSQTCDMPYSLIDEKIQEIIQVLNKVSEQESCEDEYIKIPKKALKYRTAKMVAYNVEWLKNHFDIERAIICGAQHCDNNIAEWIDDKCSACGKGIEDLIASPEWYRNENPKYCPFCGKKIQPYKSESEVDNG